MQNALGDALKQYVERVKSLARHKEVSRNEEVTKASLVGPLFTVLGWDLTRPDHCIAEYRAAAGRGRSITPIDWVFLYRERPTFVVEAKRSGESLRGYTEQLGEYFHKAEVNLGILTNGVEWQFFSDTARANKMDSEPFAIWDVLHDERPPLELLIVLQRDVYVAQKVQDFARRSRGFALPSNLEDPASVAASRQAFQELPVAERWELVTRMLKQYGSAKAVARLLGVTDRPVRNWIRASLLIPEVKEALIAGENTGLALRNLMYFFLPSNGHNPQAKPRDEQLRLLGIHRGKGRGGANKKRQP